MAKEKIKDISKGDVLTFIANDNMYKVIVCTRTVKDKSPQNFTFVALTLESVEKPTIEDVLESEFFGIGNRKADYFKYSTYELERMWSFHPEIKPYSLGTYGFIIWRKDFIKFRDNFEFIGNLDIIDNLDKNGNGSVNSSSWDFIRDFFNEKFKTVLIYRGQDTFKVKSIVNVLSPSTND